jgi:hypothetical protein
MISGVLVFPPGEMNSEDQNEYIQYEQNLENN